MPFSYPRLIQPLLDRHCVNCHDGASGAGKSKLALHGGLATTFTVSYNNLKRFVRWHEWGGASISQTVTRPGYQGADESQLVKILDDATHAPQVKLSTAERRQIYLWLDANAPFYGAYTAEEQLAQLQGKAVPPPKVQ
jgi:hypothetical protein